MITSLTSVVVAADDDDVDGDADVERMRESHVCTPATTPSAGKKRTIFTHQQR